MLRNLICICFCLIQISIGHNHDFIVILNFKITE